MHVNDGHNVTTVTPAVTAFYTGAVVGEPYC